MFHEFVSYEATMLYRGFHWLRLSLSSRHVFRWFRASIALLCTLASNKRNVLKTSGWHTLSMVYNQLDSWAHLFNTKFIRTIKNEVKKKILMREKQYFDGWQVKRASACVSTAKALLFQAQIILFLLLHFKMKVILIERARLSNWIWERKATPFHLMWKFNEYGEWFESTS